MHSISLILSCKPHPKLKYESSLLFDSVCLSAFACIGISESIARVSIARVFAPFPPFVTPFPRWLLMTSSSFQDALCNILPLRILHRLRLCQLEAWRHHPPSDQVHWHQGPDSSLGEAYRRRRSWLLQLNKQELHIQRALLSEHRRTGEDATPIGTEADIVTHISDPILIRDYPLPDNDTEKRTSKVTMSLSPKCASAKISRTSFPLPTQPPSCPCFALPQNQAQIQAG